MQLITQKCLYLSKFEVHERNLVPNKFNGDDYRFPPRDDSNQYRILVAVYCIFIDESGDQRRHEAWYYRHRDSGEKYSWEFIPQHNHDLERVLLHRGDSFTDAEPRRIE